MSTNRPFRFGRGAGLNLVGNEKTQVGYLRVENVRIDQRDIITKKTGSLAVTRSTSDDPQDDLPSADLRAVWFRENELVLETKNAIFTRRICDSASPAPDGDWIQRSGWTRATSRVVQFQDWRGDIVTNSTAALIDSQVAGETEPCTLCLAEFPNLGPVVRALVVGDAVEEGNGPNYVTVDANTAVSPHVAALRDDKLAFTYQRTGGTEADELRYQFWQPSDAFLSFTTGINAGPAPPIYDLTGVTAGNGIGYYGLIAVAPGNGERVQIRNESGAVQDDQLLAVPMGATDEALLVAIYAIPDTSETLPQFVTARLYPAAAGAAILIVDVFEAPGTGLSFRWQAQTTLAPSANVRVALTVGATRANYKLFARTALEERGGVTGEVFTNITRFSQATGGPTTIDVASRNAVFSSMAEVNGILVMGQTAISLFQDRTRRSGLFLQRLDLLPHDDAITEVVGRVDFGLPEDLVSRAARTQVSDTNVWGSRVVVGYQTETARTVVLQAMGATRTATFDFTSLPNHPAQLQQVAISAHAGYPRAYEGHRAFEQDWHELPQITNIEQIEGSIGDGNVLVAATWDATDGNGLFYRSQPDFADVFTIAGGPAGLRVTARNIQRTERLDVDLVLWRTLVNGVAFRLAARIDAKTAAAGDLLTIDLTAPDSALDGAEELDQVLGGILPSQPTRVTDFVLAADGRLFGPDPERLSLVRFTIPSSEGEAPHWPLVQGFEVESSRAVTAGAAMDGRLVFWTRTEAHTMPSGGPAANGQGAYAIPRLIPSSTGCSGHPTVALTPDGLVYGTGFTPHILTRALVTQEYADAVYKPYEVDGEAVRVSLWRPNERTTTLVNGPGAKVLVLSPETLRWMEETGRVALDIALADDRAVAWLLADGRILVEPSLPAGQSPGLDGTTGYQMLVSTPWIHWPTQNAITHTGFNFHGAQFYGERQGPHEIQMRVYFDYEATPRYSLLKTEAEVTANAAALLPYLYHFVLVQAERCFAVRVEISDGSEEAPTMLIEGIDVELTSSGDNKPATLDDALYLPAAP
jgi:hypothetical protein